MTKEKEFKGYLDRLRENLEVLDEQIVNARAMSRKRGKDANALQWTKTLRDLIELRNTTLDKIKIHLLGRDQTGAPVEPPDNYEINSDVEFEREFQKVMKPWTEDGLKVKCEDCGIESEEVSGHECETSNCDSVWKYHYLCEKCHEKRLKAKRLLECESCHIKSEDADQTVESTSKGDVKAMLQTAALQIKILKTFPIDQRISKLEELLADKLEVAPGMESAYEAYADAIQKELNNTIAERERLAETSKQ